MGTKRILILLLLTGALSGCFQAADKPGDPKSQLKGYISRSFAVGSVADKATLLEYLTGEARQRLDSWSEDQFREAFINSKRKFLTLSISELKPVNADEVDITYEVVFLNQAGGHAAKVTNKKICQLVNEKGRWLISNVHNVKELVEYQDEMGITASSP